MKTSLIAIVAALAVAGAGPALAQSAGEWTAFADKTMSQYGDPGDSPDWEDLLFAAADAHPGDPDAALAGFAEAIGLPPEEAGRYARTIMRTVSVREACEYRACDAIDRAPGIAQLIAEAAVEPSGALLTVVGKNTGDNADVLAAVRSHPARVRILADLYAYNEAPALLALMVLDAPGFPVVLAALRAEPPTAGGDPDHQDGWLVAILEHGLEQLRTTGATVEDQAVYAQIILTHYLRLGLTEEAVAAWRGADPTLRDALPLVPPEGCGVPAPMREGSSRLPDDRCPARDRGAELVDELAAALWAAGHRTEAESSCWPRARRDWVGAALMGQAHAALMDSLYRRRPADSLFDLYVDGDKTLPMPGYHGLDGQGWMSLGYGPAAARLVAERVRAAGYADIAEMIAERPPYYRGDQEPVLAAMAMSLPADVRERQAVLSPLIEAAWNAFPERPGRAPARAAVVPALWVESRLPDGMTPWREPEAEPDDDRAGEDADEAAPDDWAEDEADALDAAALDAALAADLAAEALEYGDEAVDPTLPVSRSAIVRLDDLGDQRLLIYRDSTYDLPGETGAYGLWFNRSIGGVWGEPVYLGLQEHFPYVVTPRSALPMLDGDRLQIEVQVREIDPASITFPPVGLRLKREEDGVVLTGALSELTRDSDRDGLPDLVEQRLDLDAANPDIDGDGRLDGADPTPQVAYDPAAPLGRKALALAILKQMIGYDAGAIVVAVSRDDENLDDVLAAAIGTPPVPAPPDTIIIGGDPTLFAGLDLPFRLLVYTPEALAALADRGAPFYPPTVKIDPSLDGRRHYVVWSARWVGGSFIAQCEDGAATCEIEERSSWIT